MDKWVSEKIKNLPLYLFQRVNEAKYMARREGKDIIDLGMGNPDRPTPSHIVEKLREVVLDPRTHRYSASKGIKNLRKAICDWYEERFGVGLDPEKEAVAVIGTKEGISHLMLAILNPEDVLLVPNPTHPIHIYSIAMAGGVVSDMPLLLENNFLPDLDSLNLSGINPKGILLSFPHNPTTAVIDLEFFEKTIHFARKNNLFVVHDLAYSEITFDGYKAPSILQAKGAKERAIEIYSLSKTYNMAGWRIGFVLGNKDLVGALTKLKSYYDYGIFTPIQVAAISALKSSQECVQETVAVYQKRRDILVEGLNQIGWKVESPRATMYLWVPLPERYKEMGSLDFSLLLLEKAEVSVCPGIGFGRYGEGYLRLSLVENEQRLKQAIKNIKKIL